MTLRIYYSTPSARSQREECKGDIENNEQKTELPLLQITVPKQTDTLHSNLLTRFIGIKCAPYHKRIHFACRTYR